MNKVVAVLGIIVIITLSGLFFCVGFFTGTTIFPSRLSINEEKDVDKSLTLKDVEAITDVKSASVSEKVLGILASAAGTAGESISSAVNKQKNNAVKLLAGDKSDDKLTVDSLLREITAGHSSKDDCSYDKTVAQINAPKPAATSDGLGGKKLVFIGYFKNNIAVQIQKLLSKKGYKTHVEKSKNGDGSESFVFCGPFRKDETANDLVAWLKKHEFLETRAISVSNEAIEETLYDFISDDSSMPTNTEKDIPEVPAAAIPTIAPVVAVPPVAAPAPVPVITPPAIPVVTPVAVPQTTATTAPSATTVPIITPPVIIPPTTA
ncbi:MAG: hypothetical protein LBD81_02365 [Holosporaceae bacterium]|jgi:hypothetical protein|nr:hypothetical protein [Holosporaceae bacterium]